MKSKGTAAVLALLFGGFGAHKFYLGQSGWGLIYLLTCWTFVPLVLSIIEFFLLLLMSEETFNRRFNAATMQAAPQIVVNVAGQAGHVGSTQDVNAKLKALHDLKVSGALSEDEFAAQKQRLLNGG